MCLKYLLAWCHCIMRGLLGVWRNLLIIAQWRRKKHLAWSCLCGRQKDQLLQNVHSSNPSNSSDSNDDNFWQKLANQQHFVGRSNQSNSDRNCSFFGKKLTICGNQKAFHSDDISTSRCLPTNYPHTAWQTNLFDSEDQPLLFGHLRYLDRSRFVENLG